MSNHREHYAQTPNAAKAGSRVYASKWSFLVAFLGIFFVSVSIASALDLLPNTSPAKAKLEATVTSANMETKVLAPTLPTSISIPSVGVSVSIKNPTSTDTNVLDTALLTGAVRYPTSARLGESGNVILFGHSSYLPLVNNKAFKAFDDIQKLNTGDLIMVTDGVTEFTYAVESVVKASAEGDSIPLQVLGSKLTLVTCNSFASKADRFVVTATLVKSNPLGK